MPSNLGSPVLAVLKIVFLIIECSLEHNLPDSPFASPTKAGADFMSAFANGSSVLSDPDASASSAENKLATATILPAASTLDMAAFKSFNCQMPRYSHSMPSNAVAM